MLREIDPSVGNLVKQNEGYCPGAVFKTPDTRYPCKEFREQESGVCHYGRFKKT